MEGAAGVVILMQFGEANSIKSYYFSSSFADGNRLSEQSAAASAITRSQLWILAGFASLIIGAPILAWTLGDEDKSQAQKTYVTVPSESLSSSDYVLLQFAKRRLFISTPFFSKLKDKYQT